MSKRAASLGVDWFLPGAKRRFTTTTMASSGLIEALAAEGLTWSEARDAINFDPEAREVATMFVTKGYGDTPVAEHVARFRP